MSSARVSACPVPSTNPAAEAIRQAIRLRRGLTALVLLDAADHGPALPALPPAQEAA